MFRYLHIHFQTIKNYWFIQSTTCTYFIKEPMRRSVSSHNQSHGLFDLLTNKVVFAK